MARTPSKPLLQESARTIQTSDRPCTTPGFDLTGVAFILRIALVIVPRTIPEVFLRNDMLPVPRRANRRAAGSSRPRDRPSFLDCLFLAARDVILTRRLPPPPPTTPSPCAYNGAQPGDCVLLDRVGTDAERLWASDINSFASIAAATGRGPSQCSGPRSQLCARGCRLSRSFAAGSSFFRVFGPIFLLFLLRAGYTTADRSPDCSAAEMDCAWNEHHEGHA